MFTLNCRQLTKRAERNIADMYIEDISLSNDRPFRVLNIFITRKAFGASFLGKPLESLEIFGWSRNFTGGALNYFPKGDRPNSEKEKIICRKSCIAHVLPI